MSSQNYLNNNFKDRHAFLGGSKYHWIFYDDDKLKQSYYNFLSVSRGTRIHEFASECIKLGQRLPDEELTLNMFVNDALDFKMDSERLLFFSENCFGTADAICFRDGYLRIHDLKTGVTPGHMEQLLIYASLFCLENKIRPEKIDIELRIYQNNDILIDQPDPKIIEDICRKIKRFDRIIEEIKEVEGSY